MYRSKLTLSPRLKASGGLVGVLIGLTVALLFVANLQKEELLRSRESRNVVSESNLVNSSLDWTDVATTTVHPGWEISGTVHYIDAAPSVELEPGGVITSGIVPVQPGGSYRYSTYTESATDSLDRQSQLRLLWLGPTLDANAPVSWDDVPAWRDSYAGQGPQKWTFRSGVYIAPVGATHLKLVLRNMREDTSIVVRLLSLSQEGVHIEPNPNGTQGSLAFSFDWESAMGGAVHSKGEAQHDAQAAAEHGLEMRQGADWLNTLFKTHNIRATFYATGYNLLDGNTAERTFSGDPIYKWASPKNRWGNDWWITHKWYSDDPFGTYQTQPAWYFGDQTRTLLEAGDEVASHTFGHLYVRGSNPTELSTDMEEWLTAASKQGITNTTTFAFPWRSSNSLTADFYDVLYKRGIRAVTRLYEGDLKDLYTVGAVPVYPDISVLPDFLLGAPSINAGEEAAGGSVIGLDKGLEVITETLARRGTTSFWTHPEQLADAPAFDGVKTAWRGVVEAAVGESHKGKLWISTVAEITAYQRDVRSVTTSLDRSFLGWGGWKVTVRNDSGKVLHGVTLTLPGDVQRVSSSTDVRTVYHPPDGSTRLSEQGKPVYPARQLVVPYLPPGTTTIDVEWVSGEEPLE